MKNESTEQKLARVARELGAAMRQQASGRWGAVRTAKRNLGDRHVWRFRSGEGQPDRFLHLSHESMLRGANPATTLLSQLNAAGWLDRMQRGPETSFLLSRNGELRGRSRSN